MTGDEHVMNCQTGLTRTVFEQSNSHFDRRTQYLIFKGSAGKIYFCHFKPPTQDCMHILHERVKTLLHAERVRTLKKCAKYLNP